MLKSPDELPEGVDLAVFTLPAAGVREAIEACARRKVGSAMVFAAGFAEVGDHATQDAVTSDRARGRARPRRAELPRRHQQRRRHDAAHAVSRAQALRGVENGVAFVGQSGGLLGHFQRATDGRGIPLSYVISTGNEAGLETHRLPRIPRRRSRDPRDRRSTARRSGGRRTFSLPSARCRAAGKPVVLMLAGRSAKARKSAQSHTGALIGDLATMRTQVEDAGAIVVSTMDEMMDLVEILQRFPMPPTKGPGILTASGAYVGLTNDFAEEVGLELPELEPATLEEDQRRRCRRTATTAIRSTPRPGFTPPMLPVVVKALIDDPNVGMLFISFPINTPDPGAGLQRGHGAFAQAEGDGALGDTWQLGPDVMKRREGKPGGVLALVGPHDARDRALYAIRPLAGAHARDRRDAEPIEGLPKLGKGAQPEWLGKKVLAAAGIRVPDGDLARTADEAAAVAKRIGYPVVLKAQAAALSHKTEAGGVMLNLADEAALRAAWDTMMQSVKRAAPDVSARRRAGREDVAQGHRADGRRQARSRLGHGAAAGPRRHLGRGAGRRADCCLAAPTKRRSAKRWASCARPSCWPACAARRRPTSMRSCKVVLAIGR